MVKAISTAVGIDQLRETYKEVMASSKGMGFSLVDVAIKLDYYRPIPESDI